MKRKKHISIGKWLNNNKFVAGLSLVLALILWVIVALQSNNQMEATFSDIPVTFDSTIPEELGLKMFGQTDLRVNVTVTGKRYEISSAVLSGDDFLVTASTANVSDSGKYTLPITVRPKDANRDIQIVSFTPTSVEVFFDDNLTENKPVEVQIIAPDDQIAAEGFVDGKPLLSKAEVIISGAKTEMEKIERVVAKVELEKPLSETTAFEHVALEIINTNGGTVRSTYVQIADNISEVTVTVPIYKLMQLKPTVLFKNSPSYFRDHPIAYTISPSGAVNTGISTRISGTTDSLLLGTIDFSSITTGSNTIEIPSDQIDNVKIMDDVDKFTVQFSVDGFSARKIEVPSDSAIFTALPGSVRAAIPEGTLEVTVIGLPNEIETLSAENISLTVDTSAIGDQTGEIELPVAVSVNNTESCWAYGSYTVNAVLS